ncbi:MAG: glycoside hydrolase family 5 protein [Hyphomonadaceae bacterium]
MNRRQALIGAAALAACSDAAPAPAPLFPMRRGVNLGNALEAPNEGDWGYWIEPVHLEIIARAGFDGVRLPVRWDAHTATATPYLIDEAFMRRVQTVVYGALANGLHVQLDVHHFDALIADPQAQMSRFLGVWRQIARVFADAPETLLFEVLNEPHGPHWDGAALTTLQSEALGVIREHNPQRLVVLGPGNWQNINALRRWTPPQDEHIAVSVHYYEPHEFTHHAAEWLGAEAPRFGREWGRREDIRALEAHIAEAAHWARRRSLPLQLGEFGVNRALPMVQRAAWTQAARRACEAQGMAWCVWDFAGAFAIWDRDRRVWHPQMLDALFAQ